MPETRPVVLYPQPLDATTFDPDSLAEVLARQAADHGAKVALVAGGRSLSYSELNDLADRMAGGLRARGVGPGDRVSIYSPNRWEWVVTYHGALKAGAVVNPVNVMLTAEEVAFVLSDCGSSAIVTTPDKAAVLLDMAPTIPSLRHVIAFDDAAGPTVSFGELLQSDPLTPGVVPDPSSVWTIGYTSGTTGHPKGAMQSHRAVAKNCACTAVMHARTSDDVVVSALPLPHVYGNVVVNSTFMAGGTVVLMERFDAALALALIEEHRATLFEGVPTMYAMMLAHPDIATRDLSSLSRSTVGGQTISVATMEEWERRSGAPLIELWGMTEIAGLGTTHSVSAPNVHGSIGVALPGVEVRVADFDDAGRTMPPGVHGELMVRGPIVMEGYWNNPTETAKNIEPDGWLHTGDVAYVDEDGHFFIVDRRKDMIITAGYNVYPAEIERVISGHPAVAMVAIGGQPDELKGELARAYIVLREGAAAIEEEIIEWCRPHLAPYKMPRSVRFVDDLPKTSSGKIMRRHLRTLD